MSYYPARPAGSRIADLVLDDGTVLVEDGVPTGALSTISVATNDFTLRGGDGYPFAGVAFTVLPVTYQQAFLTYLTGELGGVVRAADYPGQGRGAHHRRRLTPHGSSTGLVPSRGRGRCCVSRSAALRRRRPPACCCLRARSDSSST